ncbi:energy-coupling factor transport system ATP-binding protein [Tumebacillus sp. BK434]|uniref:ABC transporter ATP-binding protein n=1 Tax=Tumebacillus sp. BK434 TaxID=2512169 RepID=UPI00104E4F22|nr:ABC transporter ATP-binding protein [Tumebacillus sp. BK434]TCP55702.1 energy-coupling factor transport system ATP-binding protein [Tumebacillus sp. BK434]
MNDVKKTPFLGCERVSVQFFDRETPVLKEMTVSIAKKEAVLLLGPSGSGKSTLAQVLSGIIPRSIEAWMKGDVYRPDRVGVMFQDPDAQFCMLTVEDEIAFSLENRQVPPAQMRSEIERLMREVRLDLPLQKPISELSGGLKQRLALACLLALEPEVLFFDEPTAQLDPENTRLVLQDIARLRGEKTLVVIEHKLESVMEWIDRVLLFAPDGSLQGEGRPEDVLRDHAQAIRDYGIWTPRMWPVTWEELLRDPAHQLAQRLQASPPVPQQMDKTEPLLEVRDLRMSYRGGADVWSDVNVSVQPGEWIAVMGPNGAGKSTFLKAVGGLLPVSGGQVLLKGKELGKYKPEALYDTVGFVFQNPEHQFIADTVYEEVAFGGKLARWPQEQVEREATQLLADFHLEALAAKNPFTLSQGQKRRLSVAGMLLKNQELLLLDEPTFGQDAATTRELVDRIRERNAAGTTVMMATHDVELVAETASRVLVFAERGLLFDGTPQELFAQPQLLARAALIEPLAYEYQRRKAAFEEGSVYA